MFLHTSKMTGSSGALTSVQLQSGQGEWTSICVFVWLVYPSLSDHLYSYFLNFLVHLSLLCEEYPLIYNGEIIRTQNHSSYACWQFGMDNGSSVLLFKASVQPFSFFFCSWERHVCAYMCVYTHRHLYIGNNGIFFNCITLHYSPIT